MCKFYIFLIIKLNTKSLNSKLLNVYKKTDDTTKKYNFLVSKKKSNAKRSSLIKHFKPHINSINDTDEEYDPSMNDLDQSKGTGSNLIKSTNIILK